MFLYPGTKSPLLETYLLLERQVNVLHGLAYACVGFEPGRCVGSPPSLLLASALRSFWSKVGDSITLLDVLPVFNNDAECKRKHQWPTRTSWYKLSILLQGQNGRTYQGEPWIPLTCLSLSSEEVSKHTLGTYLSTLSG